MPTTTVYLILAPGPVVRAVRKNRPFLDRDETAVKLTLDVPTDFFRKSIPEARIEIPESAAIRPVIGIEIETEAESDEVPE